MVSVESIGTIHTPFETIEDAPSQGMGPTVQGELVLREEYVPALEGLSPVDDVDVVWHADQGEEVLETKTDRGAFSTRSPDRPNRICVSPCRILQIDEPTVLVQGVDMLDGTTLLDIKPSLEGTGT